MTFHVTAEGNEGIGSQERRGNRLRRQEFGGMAEAVVQIQIQIQIQGGAEGEIRIARRKDNERTRIQIDEVWGRKSMDLRGNGKTGNFSCSRAGFS